MVIIYHMPKLLDYKCHPDLDSYIANALENAMLDYESGEGGYETVDDAFHGYVGSQMEQLEKDISRGTDPF